MDFAHVYTISQSKYSLYTTLTYGFASQSSYSLCKNSINLNPRDFNENMVFYGREGVCLSNFNKTCLFHQDSFAHFQLYPFIIADT